MEYIEAYKDFLKNGKTERECVVQFVKMAEDAGYKNLDENAKKIFDVDLLASDLYSLGTDNILPCSKDFTTGIIKRH